MPALKTIRRSLLLNMHTEAELDSFLNSQELEKVNQMLEDVGMDMEYVKAMQKLYKVCMLQDQKNN